MKTECFIEYFDLMQLLKAITRRIGKFESFNFKLYNEEDTQLCISENGESFAYFEDTPLSLNGKEMKVAFTLCNIPGIWDIRIVFSGVGITNYTTDTRLNRLEDLCEKYGYCVTYVDIDNNQLFLEIMDRIIIDGKAYNDVFDYCKQFSIDYYLLCEKALIEDCSTIQVIVEQLSEDRAIENEKISPEILPYKDLESVVAFNDNNKRK